MQFKQTNQNSPYSSTSSKTWQKLTKMGEDWAFYEFESIRSN